MVTAVVVDMPIFGPETSFFSHNNERFNICDSFQGTRRSALVLQLRLFLFLSCPSYFRCKCLSSVTSALSLKCICEAQPLSCALGVPLVLWLFHRMVHANAFPLQVWPKLVGLLSWATHMNPQRRSNELVLGKMDSTHCFRIVMLISC